LVNTLNAALYSHLDYDNSLTDLAVKRNKIIYNASTSDRFITCFLAVLTPETGELDIVNAGHNPILLRKSDGTLYKINAGGVGLGMLDMDLPYEGEKLTLQSGERLFLFTDGIPEAMNGVEEEYTDEKMENFFLENITETAQEFVDKIVSDVKSFTGEAEQSDDITTMYLIKK
jgi:sigma-B regulation protein RsbU (phosphoserine phosphatase)